MQCRRVDVPPFAVLTDAKDDTSPTVIMATRIRPPEKFGTFSSASAKLVKVSVERVLLLLGKLVKPIKILCAGC